MKLILRLLLWLLLFVVVAAVAFLVLFDANEFKDQIEHQVHEQTGRTLDIAGDIELSFIPIGIELNQVELSNAEGFKQPLFARIESLVIKIPLIPLIRQELQIDALKLHGLWLFLEVDNSGHNNWQDLADSGKEEGDVVEVDAKDEPPVTDESDRPAAPMAALAVNGIDISGADIQYDDRQNNSLVRVSNFSLQTEDIAFGEAFELVLHAELSQRQADVEQAASIDLKTRLTLQQTLQQFSLDELVLGVKARVPAIQQQVMEMDVTLDADIDLAKEQVDINDAVINAMYAKLMLDAKLANWSQSMTVTGTLTTESIDPREVAYRFAVELPPMQGANAMSKLQITAPFRLQGDDFKTQPTIAFDDSRIDAELSVALASQAIRYDLTLDSIDLNRYMPPPPPETAEQSPAAETAPVPEQDLPIPLELIRSLDVAGKLKIGTARILEYDIDNLEMQTRVADGMVNISPLDLDVLEGHVKAHTTVDARKDVPSLKQRVKVTQVQIGSVVDPIVAQFVPKQKIDVSGKGDVELDVSTQGKRISSFIENLDGKAVIDFKNIMADGLDIDYLMSTTVADFTSSKSLPEKIGLTTEYRPGTETAFEVIHAGFDIDNGVATTKDMLLDSSHIDVTGKGWVNIVKQTMDMDIISDLTLYKVSSVTDKLADEPLPVHVTGSWTAPLIDIDYGPMKNRFKREYTDKLKAKVTKKTDAVKQKLDNKLDAKKPSLDKKKDEVKQKLKNKLKGLFK